MNKKSRLFISTALLFTLLLVALSAYFHNALLSIGVLSIILIYGFFLTQKKFKYKTSIAIVLIIADLLIFSLLCS